MAGEVVVAVVVADTMISRTKEEAEDTTMTAIRAVGGLQGGATQEAGDTRMMAFKGHPEVVAAMKAGGLAGADTRTISIKDQGAAAGAEADTTGAGAVAAVVHQGLRQRSGGETHCPMT